MPVVYTTAYYSLVVRGRVQPGETVLIHSGSGGVGQAAIAIALSLGCRVFTTVGRSAGPPGSPGLPPPPNPRPSPAAWLTGTRLCLPGSAEKRAYLQARFPQLDDTSFANSRDTSFEQHVLRHTAGKGEWLEGLRGHPRHVPLCSLPTPLPSPLPFLTGPGSDRAWPSGPGPGVIVRTPLPPTPKVWTWS